MNSNHPEHRMREGDADRDQLLSVVQRAYEAGRLDLDEMHAHQKKRSVRFTDECPIIQM